MENPAVFKLTSGRCPHIDCWILAHPQRVGAVIGFYGGLPITDAVDDGLGRRYVYAGIAPRKRNGTYDVESLSKGEWIVDPGLVYYSDPSRPVDRRKSLLSWPTPWLGQFGKRTHGQ
jgi:hypothetical protein